MNRDIQTQTDIATEPVFLESTLNYRHWFPIGFLLVFTPVCIWMVCTLVWTLATRPVGEWFPGVLFFVAWLSLAGTGTVLLGWRVLFSPTVDTRIDGTGIWIGGRLHPWKSILRIWGQAVGKGVTLSFQEKSLLRLDQMIPMAQPLTLDGYSELLEELASYLRKRFPHVDLG